MKKLFTGMMVFILATYPMIAGAFTLSNVKHENFGSEHMVSGTMVFDSSYPTNGETLNARDISCSMLEEIVFQDSEGYTFSSNIAGSKQTAAIKVFKLGQPEYEADRNMVTRPAIRVIYNGDCDGELNARPLLAREHYGNGIKNILSLESNTYQLGSVLGETANGTVGGASRAARFWVSDVANSNGALSIYVSDSAGANTNRLTFNSPTGQDGFIVMPFEDTGGASSVPGFAVALRVYHSSTASSDKTLFFDDNGAPNSQLCFADNQQASNNLATAGIEILGPQYVDGRVLSSAPEVGNASNLSSLEVGFVITCK